MIKLSNVSKKFRQGTSEINVLENLNLEIKAGEKVAIVGPSGSGKSTLLSIISGMDKPDTGEVWLNNQNLVSLSESELSGLRNQEIGIVFQNFELIPAFTALENVMLPLEVAGKPDHQKAISQLKELGLGHRLDHLPSQLSGGEQQRVAIARALINNPGIIFADEPTGNLDRETGNKVADLFIELLKDQNKTLVMITHDPQMAARMDRTYQLKAGKVYA